MAAFNRSPAETRCSLHTYSRIKLPAKQDKILRDGVMLNAPKQLIFPAKPSVSQEAKDFLSECVVSIFFHQLQNLLICHELSAVNFVLTMCCFKAA